MRVALGLALLVALVTTLYVLNTGTPAPPTPAPLAAEVLEQLPEDRKGQVLIYAFDARGGG